MALAKKPRPAITSNLELHRTARVISIDLDLAAAFYETFVPTGRDEDLLNHVNKTDFYPAFNIISDSLNRNAIMALCRIWDTRPDTADMNSLSKALRDGTILSELDALGHTIDPDELGNWQSGVAAVNNSDELMALKRARHKALAHTATPNEVYKGTARAAQYGDERRVLEMTIPLVEQVNGFIGYSYVETFAEQRRIRQEHARKFWARFSGQA
jgi:hypothetical protein